MTEKESNLLEKRAAAAGISKAEFVRQMVFGQQPQPLPEPAFWAHMEDLYAIHALLQGEPRRRMQQLILDIQAEATQPKEVSKHGNHQPVAHQGQPQAIS